MRTEVVISPRRTPSRRRLANIMLRMYQSAVWTTRTGSCSGLVWNEAGGKVETGLLRRRQAEAAMVPGSDEA